jgi:hypothetical protein
LTSFSIFFFIEYLVQHLALCECCNPLRRDYCLEKLDRREKLMGISTNNQDLRAIYLVSRGR